jgi:hypothetical protein
LLLVGDIEQIGARTAAGAGDLRDDLLFLRRAAIATIAPFDAR